MRYNIETYGVNIVKEFVIAFKNPLPQGALVSICKVLPRRELDMPVTIIFTKVDPQSGTEKAMWCLCSLSEKKLIEDYPMKADQEWYRSQEEIVYEWLYEAQGS